MPHETQNEAPRLSEFLDVHAGFEHNVGDDYIKKQQIIPDSFVKGLRDEKFDNRHRNLKEDDAALGTKVASIPTLFVEQMLKDGLDVYSAPLEDILGWLRKRDLTDFITSSKV